MRPMLAAAPTRDPGTGANKAASVGNTPPAISVPNATALLLRLNLP